MTARNPLTAMAWRLEKTLSNQGAPCSISGSYDNVEMHHIKALKDIKNLKNSVHRHIIAIERKQIPVCKKHPLELHGGNWSKKPNNSNLVNEIK